jgi:hypothetical protein
VFKVIVIAGSTGIAELKGPGYFPILDEPFLSGLVSAITFPVYHGYSYVPRFLIVSKYSFPSWGTKACTAFWILASYQLFAGPNIFLDAVG